MSVVTSVRTTGLMSVPFGPSIAPSPVSRLAPLAAASLTSFEIRCAPRVDEGPDDRCGVGGVADGQCLDPLHVPRDERNRVQGREGNRGHRRALGSHDRWAPNGRDWRGDYLRSVPGRRIW